MPTPGIGDPYWYEWYVGLKHIVEMINPDSGIECVIFQHTSYDTIDDVVVEYKTGAMQLCYQVKHEIATSAQHNLTFGKLIEKDSNQKCLLAEIFSGWETASNSGKVAIMPVLFTNRQLGTRKSNRTFNGQTYKAYPIEKFLSLLKEQLIEDADCSGLSWKDTDLANQWNEMCAAIGITNVEKAAPFIKSLSIYGNQLGLADMEQSLISTLATMFSCTEGLAKELFSQLVFGLRVWTTSRRGDERVTIENVYSVLSAEEDINESQHRLVPPYPFFESRQAFCKQLEQQIKNTDKKVVFISGDPGSGKTSTISYLQSTTNIFLLRYHTFRPISPEQYFYDVDAGMCSSENLWGTLLIQLRQKFKGKLAQYNVPINNKLLTVEMMRSHVCRLLGILAGEAFAQNERIYVCIDGIDHAARANSVVSFLSTLLLPNEIPDGVCFIIVGQPSSIYQAQYPIWLSTNDNIERINMPKLCANDIIQLISCKAPQFEPVADGLANVIYQYTEGNNLSTVFAIEEIKEIHLLDDAIAKLGASGITSDVQQYYAHIWEYMKNEILKMGLQGIFPESIVACPILLMNGRVHTKILSRALPYALNENDWKLILNKLYPLISACGEDGEYILFHNDFRVYLMGIISNYRARYEEIALALAKDLLQNDEGLLTYVAGIPLLQCANRTDLIPKYFTSTFVINALAEGISKKRLDDYAHLSYEASYSNHDMEGYVNTYLAVKTLYQHIRYYEYYGREYVSNDYPEIASIDISEIRVLPIASENLSEYEKVLDLCKKLFKSGMPEHISRSLALYNKWYDGISPYSFIPLCESKISKNESWHINTDEIGVFLQYWGETAAELNIQLSAIDVPSSELQHRVLTIFGEAYFRTCIDQGMMDYAVIAINGHYVPKYCFEDKLETIFFSGYTDKVEQYLPKISIKQDKPSTNLLAMAMLVTRQCDMNFDTVALAPSTPVNHIYDETSFAIILRAFLLGHCERAMDDAVICGHVSICYSDLEEKQPVINQISYLSKFACLLGKYYWDSAAKTSTAFLRFTMWFLTTQLQRWHDYSRARRFLLVTLLQSPAGEALANTDVFLVGLKTYLFQVENLGMYYKTCILDYLQRHNQLDIVREYILTLYGDDCSEINTEENKVETHKIFCPYGQLVEPEMMKRFTKRLKWDVVGYMGHKEYAMQGLSEYFEYISANNPLLWHDSGIRLYQQSKIAEISGNKYAYDIRNNVMKAAVHSGIDHFWKLYYLDDEFYMNPDLIYHALFEFIQTAGGVSDLEAVWMISSGIHSWYRQEDRLAAKNVFDACQEKALEFGTNFREIVLNLTPQWMTIVDHESEKTGYQTETDSYVKQKATEISAIEAEYNSSTVEDLLLHLPNTPMLSYSEERYSIVINKLISQKKLSAENARLVLDSLCSYLNGREWSYEKLDIILPMLLPVLGEDIFWSFARTIENHLSDYDYQTSTRNMHLLLKNYFSSNMAQMKMLFEQELTTQELWTSGDGHIPVNYKFNSPKKYFNIPRSAEEMALYILLEQISTQNARKMENAIFALRILGKRFESLMDVIALEWSQFSDMQKDCLLLVIVCWIYDGADIKKLQDVLFKEYNNCDLLSRKYYLHSIFLLMNLGKIDKDIVCFSAESFEYSLPQYGYGDKAGGYENYLSLIEEFDDSSTIADRIMYDFSCDNQIDWCLGNFGLLVQEGSIEETKRASINHGGISLFNRIGGAQRLCFGNIQIVPASAWREIFNCVPSSISPHIWVDEYGNEVLWLEYFSSPIRDAAREAYTRQPILFRWVGNSDWMQNKLEELRLRLRYISSTEKILQ